MNFRIRASAAGLLLTEPKTNKAKEAGELSETTKTYLHEWIISQKYGRVKDITSKHMEKGTLQEDLAIDLFAEVYDLGLLIKNDTYFRDDFMTGTPDIILNDLVVDVKCSWDVFTFPYFQAEPPKNYFYQLQVYMHLVGLKKSQLAYVLVDTPEHLIEREAWNMKNSTGYDFDYCMEKKQRDLIFSDIPSTERVKVYDVFYEQEVIEKLKDQVVKCRKYIEIWTKS